MRFGLPQTVKSDRILCHNKQGLKDIMDMSDLCVTLTITATAGVLLLTYFWSSRRDPKYPPSPTGAWPIFGHLLQFSSDPHEKIARFKNQCGDIFSLKLGPKSIIVLAGIDVVKEVFAKSGINLTNKMQLYVDTLTDMADKGITATNGAAWREHKTFTTTILKNTGLGNNLLCDKIQDEVNHLMVLLESFKGEPKDIDEIAKDSLINIICSVLVGQRYQYDDQEFKTISKNVRNILYLVHGTIVVNLFSWLKFVPFYHFRCKSLKKSIQDLFDIFDRYHVNENDGRVEETGSLIAAYIQVMNKKKMKGEMTYMSKQSLKRLIFDLFVAGIETMSNTFAWFFLYMVNYPDVQEKIFQEIKEVVGLERAPVLQDKIKLTYLMATIMEVQRLGYVVPQTFPRVVPCDVNLRGYNIPKGTEIVVSLALVMRDRSVWGDDADKFRPERFIAKDGGLISPEAWIPFFNGKRFCVAEGMAMMGLFLYLSNILQRFRIFPADPKEIPVIKRRFHFTVSPVPFLARFLTGRSD